MTANQVQLQFAQLRLFDVDIGELAETGIDAVDGAALDDNLFHDAARSFDA